MNLKVPLGYIKVFVHKDGERKESVRKIVRYERLDMKYLPFPRNLPVPQLEEGEYIERNMRGDTLIFRRID
jgi:hypothetical protein